MCEIKRRDKFFISVSVSVFILIFVLVPMETTHPKRSLALAAASAPEEPETAPFLGVVDPLRPYDSKRLYEDTRTLARFYPEALSVTSIGQSVLGKEIPLLKLGRGERHVLWVGALHAREVMTCAYLLLMAEEYANAYCTSAPYDTYAADKVQWLLDEFTVYLVPMANPDGVDVVTAKGSACVPINTRETWKANANGVNLNRNFPFDWESNTYDGFPNNYLNNKGPSPASEPETLALIALSESEDFEFLVSCHCSGQVLYWRDNKNGVVPGDEFLAQTISGLTGYTMLPSTKIALNGWAGGLENWFRCQYNRPAICLELGLLDTADAVTMAKFYSAEMLNWSVNKNMIWEVLCKISN
ncbi:MAG: hypothetical protein FWG14_08170 [Peptococcaceae bacterium]|nr:hypothetical protein [Peptococcaceae bacterium]